MEMRVPLTVKLPINIIRKTKWYVATCPAMDVVSQGRTEEEARNNLGEALYLFLTSCIDRGTLDRVLEECGLTQIVSPGEGAGAKEEKPCDGYIDIPPHLLAELEGRKHCRSS